MWVSFIECMIEGRFDGKQRVKGVYQITVTDTNTKLRLSAYSC